MIGFCEFFHRLMNLTRIGGQEPLSRAYTKLVQCSFHEGIQTIRELEQASKDISMIRDLLILCMCLLSLLDCLLCVNTLLSKSL